MIKMNVNEFEKFLNRKKQYRDLDDIYKTPKFLMLYLKMYTYILSIPKDKIVIKKIQKYYTGITYYFLDYILHFLKAKDFYHWRERLYKLMTENHEATSFKTYELLYGQKVNEFFNEYSEKRQKSCVKTNLERYGCEYPWQSEEVKEKIKQTNLERHGVENPSQCEEVREKIIQTNLERRGCEYPLQSKEVREKIIQTNLERYGCKIPSQNKEVREKINNTKLKKYGNIFGNVNNHSKIADEFCTNLYTKLSDNIKPYTIFFKKSNKEYMLEITGKKYYYDFTISSEKIKLIIEFDGLYWHGLQEGQKDVRGIPVEEIWEMDKEKQKLAEDNGFKVIRVREDEYLKNKEEILQRVLKCIKG